MMRYRTVFVVLVVFCLILVLLLLLIFLVLLVLLDRLLLLVPLLVLVSITSAVFRHNKTTRCRRRIWRRRRNFRYFHYPASSSFL